MKARKIFALVLSMFLTSCTNTAPTSSEETHNPGNDTQERQDSSREDSDSDILIAYFSGTGRTETIAGYIEEATSGTLFEIEPVDEYTSEDLNYNNSNSRVVREHNDESLQNIELKVTTPEGFATFDTVFIGFPIWWQGPAWPIFNFVKDNDFTGKTVIPFATSASSGMGSSKSTLENMAGTGTWLEGRRFQSSASKETITTWVSSLGL